MVSYAEYLENYDENKTDDLYYKRFAIQADKIETLINSLELMQQGMLTIKKHLKSQIKSSGAAEDRIKQSN